MSTPNPHIAISLGEMVSGKQLGFIRAIAREMGIDPGTECQAHFGCSISELKKRSASDFIEHLQDMQRNQTK